MTYGYYEVSGNSGRRDSITEKAAKTITALACVGGAFFGAWRITEWTGHHFIGSVGPRAPRPKAITYANNDYNQVFAHASPAGKFVMQYLRSDYVDSTEYAQAHGIRGLSPQNWETRFNNGCLNKTAYDINGGNINVLVEGLFLYANVSASIPSAAAYAEINPTNPNQLVVESGHSNSVNLVFNGLNSGTSELTPATSTTRDILKTYGCQVGRIATYSTGAPIN